MRRRSRHDAARNRLVALATPVYDARLGHGSVSKRCTHIAHSGAVHSSSDRQRTLQVAQASQADAGSGQ
jgi:hypothetical protein